MVSPASSSVIFLVASFLAKKTMSYSGLMYTMFCLNTSRMARFILFLITATGETLFETIIPKRGSVCCDLLR